MEKDDVTISDIECPLCRKAPAFYVHGGVFKCRRNQGGCGKIFRPDLRTTKSTKPTHTTISCVDCQTKRAVKLQDVFQVKRCIPCQRKFRLIPRKRNHDDARDKRTSGEGAIR